LISGKRSLKNVGGRADNQIEEWSTAFVEHRKAFLDQAIITIEITVFRILDDVGIISAKVDQISMQLQWVSRQIPDLGT